jgi:hypothetical protein
MVPWARQALGTAEGWLISAKEMGVLPQARRIEDFLRNKDEMDDAREIARKMRVMDPTWEHRQGLHEEVWWNAPLAMLGYAAACAVLGLAR